MNENLSWCQEKFALECLYWYDGITGFQLLEVLSLFKLTFVSSCHFLWLMQMRLAIPVSTGIHMVLHLRPEFIRAIVLLRKLDTFLFQLLWIIVTGVGVLLYNGVSLISLSISFCLVTIFKTCHHLMWYYRLRELLQLVIIGFLLILHSWEILIPAKIMDSLTWQQELRFFYLIHLSLIARFSWFNIESVHFSFREFEWELHHDNILFIHYFFIYYCYWRCQSSLLSQ